MTSLEQTRQCGENLRSEAKVKAFERIGFNFEYKTWSKSFQHLNKVKLSPDKGIQLASVPHLICCRVLRDGEMLQSPLTLWVVCCKILGRGSFFVGRSPSRAYKEQKSYSEILCYVWGAFRKEQFKPARWGRQLAPLLDGPCKSCAKPNGTVYDCTKNTQPLSLPDVHNTQHVCVSWVQLVWSLFGAVGRPSIHQKV